MAKISELIAIVKEGIRAKDSANAHVLEHTLDDILWKIRSGRQPDVDVSDTLRFTDLIKNENVRTQQQQPASADAGIS